MKKPELLAPAGNLEKLEMAITYGADAVYLGGKSFGLRAGAGNFSLEEMKLGIKFAHDHGAKVYVTANIFAHNDDLVELPQYLKQLEEINVDALIISDPGIFRIAREVVPNMPIHISTQANNTNWSSVQFWRGMGAERVVLARELSLNEIKEIHKKNDIELEAFVHGAMCISYSGRCLLSNYFTGRNANKGECAHPCRWNYQVVEEQRPGQYFHVEEDERGTYIFNSKDLRLIEFLPELIDAGVTSFKIEGRMKSVYYVATIIKAYREAIDAYFDNPTGYIFQPAWLEELGKVSHRDYTTGFAFNKPTELAHNYESAAYERSYDFVGVVLDYNQETGIALIEQRNRLLVGDEVEFLPPKGKYFTWKIPSMKNQKGEEIEAAPHPRQIITMPLPYPVEPRTLIRRA